MLHMGWVPIICEWCDYCVVSNAALTVSASVSGKMKQWTRLPTMRSGWGHHIGIAFFIFKFCVALICLCVCACMWRRGCEGQRTTFESWFSLTAVCVPRIKFKLSSFTASTFSYWAILPVPQSLYYHILIKYNNDVFIIYFPVLTIIIFPTNPLLTSTLMPFLMYARFNELHWGPLSSGSVWPSFLP